MILLALMAIGQDVPAPAPAPPAEEGVEEIVVQATLGRTVMLFDKGADGKLHNCRIMVSSGSQKRDTDACQATPVCYAKTADEVTDCVELSFIEPRTPGLPVPAGSGKPQIFDMPVLAKPKPPLAPNVLGPSETSEASKDTERQRVKLPPLPQDTSNEPVIRVTTKASNASDQ